MFVLALNKPKGIDKHPNRDLKTCRVSEVISFLTYGGMEEVDEFPK